MSMKTVSAVFEEYQELRKPRMKKVLNLAYQLTRLQAWDGPLMKLTQRYVIPWVGDERVADHFAGIVKGGVKLDFVPTPDHRPGSWEWDDERVAAKNNPLGVILTELRKRKHELVRTQSMMLLFLGCAFLGACSYFSPLSLATIISF